MGQGFAKLSVGALLLAAGLLAQQTDRKASPSGMLTRGEVLAADASPWAGVRVTFVSRPRRHGITLDRVEVEADARGRFRVRLHPNLTYIVWAQTDPDESGSWRSCARTTCRAGTRIQLQELPERRAAPTVLLPPVEGLPYEEMRVELKGACLEEPILVPSGRSLRLPAGLPGRAVTLQLRDPRGRLLVSQSVSLAAKQPRAVKLKALDLQRHSLLLRFVDRDQKPIPGVRVTEVDTLLRPKSRSLSASGAQGWLRAEHTHIPVRAPWLNSLHCIFDATGFQQARLDLLYQVLDEGKEARWDAERFPIVRSGQSIEALRKAGNAHRVYSLRAGHSVRGRLLIDAKRPAASIRLRCRFAPHRLNPAQTTSYENHDWGVTTQTGEDGSFSVDGVAGDFALFALLPARARRALGAANVHPQALVASGRAEEPVDLGDVRLDSLQRTSLKLRTPGGQAARYAQVALASEAGDTAMDYGLDRLGRVDVLLPRTARYRVACRVGSAVIDRALRLGPGTRDLALAPSGSISGKVESGDGQALQGVRVALRISQRRGVGSALLSRFKLRPVETDVSGVYRIPIPVGAARVDLDVRFYHRGRWHTIRGGSGASFNIDRDGGDLKRDFVLESVVGGAGPRKEP